MTSNIHFLKSQAAHLFWLTLVLIFRCDRTGSSQLSLHMPPRPRLFGGLVNHNTIKLIQETHVTCPKHESPAIKGLTPVLGFIGNPFSAWPTSSNHLGFCELPLSRLFGGLVELLSHRPIQQTHPSGPKHGTPTNKGGLPILVRHGKIISRWLNRLSIPEPSQSSTLEDMRLTCEPPHHQIDPTMTSYRPQRGYSWNQT